MKRPTLFFTFNNAGHLPAHTVCISTTVSAYPVVGPGGYEEQRNPLMRQRGKDGNGKMLVIESRCPTIGGDSSYAFIVRSQFFRQVLEQVKAKLDSQLFVNADVQYCDPFGKYYCTTVWLQYLREPINGFQQLSEIDCSGMYRVVPNIPQAMYGTNEQLPACSAHNEGVKNQEDFMRSLGWKPIPPQEESPK
jgi:hypothetical protein